MKNILFIIGIIFTLFLQGCSHDVDTVSSASVKATVVIKKAEDITLVDVEKDLNSDGIKEQIRIVYKQDSLVTLSINDDTVALGNELHYMIESDHLDKYSNFEVEFVEDKVFVVNQRHNEASGNNDISIWCYRYADNLTQVWYSKDLSISVENKVESLKEIVLRNDNFIHHLTLEDGMFKAIKDLTITSCNLGESLDYRFVDYDDDNHTELLLKGKVLLNDTYNLKSFYRVYELSDTVDLDRCGFNDVKMEDFFN